MNLTLDQIRGPGVESLRDAVTGEVLYADAQTSVMLPKPISGTSPDKLKLHAPLFVQPGTWIIPARLESEANRDRNRQSTIARKSAVKRAVFKAVGPHWRVFGPVGDAIRDGLPATILVIRLGGNGLDTANLWRAVKPVEDALAVLMGCDDGWPAWKAAFDVGQEPGELWGVRVEMRLNSCHRR